MLGVPLWKGRGNRLRMDYFPVFETFWLFVDSRYLWRDVYFSTDLPGSQTESRLKISSVSFLTEVLVTNGLQLCYATVNKQGGKSDKDVGVATE